MARISMAEHICVICFVSVKALTIFACSTLKIQQLEIYHLPLWKTLETDSEQDVDLTHLVYATGVCSQACQLNGHATAAAELMSHESHRSVPPFQTSEVLCCNLEAFWLDGNHLLQTQQQVFLHNQEELEVVPDIDPLFVLQEKQQISIRDSKRKTAQRKINSDS